MAAKKDNKTTSSRLAELRTQLLDAKLAIRAHQEKNTNAHKSLKKQIAQLLTSA